MLIQSTGQCNVKTESTASWDPQRVVLESPDIGAQGPAADASHGKLSPRQTRLEMDVRERSSTRNADALETWLPLSS